MGPLEPAPAGPRHAAAGPLADRGGRLRPPPKQDIEEDDAPAAGRPKRKRDPEVGAQPATRVPPSGSSGRRRARAGAPGRQR